MAIAFKYRTKTLRMPIMLADEFLTLIDALDVDFDPHLLLTADFTDTQAAEIKHCIETGLAAGTIGVRMHHIDSFSQADGPPWRAVCVGGELPLNADELKWLGEIVDLCR